jgi:hypothetical protein
MYRLIRVPVTVEEIFTFGQRWMVRLVLMSEVIRPGVIHVSGVKPAGIQHEGIEAARMSISEIWKRLKQSIEVNCDG